MADKTNKNDPELSDELLKGQEWQMVLSSEAPLGDLQKVLAERTPTGCGDGRAGLEHSGYTGAESSM